MSRINVIVASGARGYVAESLASSVEAHPDMTLVTGEYVPVERVDALIDGLPLFPHCAVALVGQEDAGDDLAHRWLSRRADLVVMLIDADNIVRLAVGNPRLSSLLNALRDFVEGVNAGSEPRLLRVVSSAPGPAEDGAESPRPSGPVQPPSSWPPPVDQSPPLAPPDRPLLRVATAWVHEVLRGAIDRVPDANGDVTGLSVTKRTLVEAFDAANVHRADGRPASLTAAEEALTKALADANPDAEPLARTFQVFGCDAVEFRLLLLALAPELELRFQRAIGFLLDELPRRTGTFALYASLLGETGVVRGTMNATGNLSRWLVLDEASWYPAADEPFRVDPYLAAWLLGAASGLEADPRVRAALRPDPWPGSGLLTGRREIGAAEDLIRALTTRPPRYLVLDGDEPEAWRALLELGARAANQPLLRVDAYRLAAADVLDVESCAVRLGRLARLTGRPLVVDAVRAGASDNPDEWLRRFLTSLGRSRVSAALICTDDAMAVRCIGEQPFELRGGTPLSAEGRVSATREAARAADVLVTTDVVNDLHNRYPLPLDRLEYATQLASGRPIDFDGADAAFARFTTALKEVAAEGLSHFAERIEPVFDLDDVVLPPDRHRQLIEIVDNVRYASRVLDEWRFGAQLPYGRGVTALFSGASGTGKTMAAIGIARRLGISILRLDLSKVVSKYIGDTEKNIDRVFGEAERTGSAILIDEADALLARRSEVRDAHDRYANIEVAYLLTRMEAFGATRACGPAIMTTNMRQALDPAFVRRLRFILEFPRPSVEARERIWRQCLPEGSHLLDDAMFKQLARRVDLTGGHIRQITLRAAFLAAAAGTLITAGHVAHAASAEVTKLGLPAVDFDLSSTRAAA